MYGRIVVVSVVVLMVHPRFLGLWLKAFEILYWECPLANKVSRSLLLSELRCSLSAYRLERLASVV